MGQITKQEAHQEMR